MDEDQPPPGGSLRPTRGLVKIGGEVAQDLSALSLLLGQLVELARVRPCDWVIVHGAGPQAGELQRRLGIEPRKVAGRRVTDAATLQVVKQALGGEVNLDVVAAATGAGLRPVGLSAASGGLVEARRLLAGRARGAEDADVDYGFVGEVARVDPSLVLHLWSGGYTPVVSPLSLGSGPTMPQVFNVNADTVAAELAAALRVDHLFLVTSVPGVLRDREDATSRIPQLTASAARAAIEDGTIVGGMIPKVADVLPFLGRGIAAVHIIGVSETSLLDAARAPGTSGTVLLPDREVESP